MSKLGERIVAPVTGVNDEKLFSLRIAQIPKSTTKEHQANLPFMP